MKHNYVRKELYRLKRRENLCMEDKFIDFVIIIILKVISINYN